MAKVIAVVDGDTLKVTVNGRAETVRLIGVDAPEPGEGNAATSSTAFVRKLVEGKDVELESDSKNTDRDMYQRLLRYVHLPDGRMLNAEIITRGHALVYMSFPFTRLAEFVALEEQARASHSGLWATFRYPEEKDQPQSTATQSVYVTATGSKYHRAGCRYLKTGTVKLSLQQIAGRYTPCRICTP